MEGKIQPGTTLLSQQATEYFQRLQDAICTSLEKLDGLARFRQDLWTHHDGGGGRTRVLQNGEVFEKAGVNTSAVGGMMSAPLAARLSVNAQRFFATGISLVLHPTSPMIPTVHMNLRYIELENADAWFGGGADLTPYYLFTDDAHHFHTTLKTVCDKHDLSFYPRFKEWCDEYFTIKHRGEARGIGGIFFDYQRERLEEMFALVQDIGNTFLDAYIPIVERRRSEPWGTREKQWQLIRRGRYVEFNLVYDRGTLFGLETQGRTDSILVSLPPEVKWPYKYEPELGSREAELLRVLKEPRNWT